MRISCDHEDLGYPNYAAADIENKAVIIHLDGKEVAHCITADEELGLVVTYAVDADGELVIDPADEGKLVHRTLHGKVTIYLQPRPEKIK